MNRESTYFEDQFNTYDEIKGNGWGMNWRAYMILRGNVVLKLLKRELESRDDCMLMEIGCATGDFTGRFLHYTDAIDIKVLGIDISDKAINICKEKYKEVTSCSFEVGALPQLNFQNQFDVILCMDVMEYFDLLERNECYENIRSCLKPNGVLLFQTPLNDENADQIINQISHYFCIREKKYVYGQLWYDIAEKRLDRYVKSFYFVKSSFTRRLIGYLSYRIMKCKPLVAFFFLINKLLFPRRRSHIVLICEPIA